MQHTPYGAPQAATLPQLMTSSSMDTLSLLGVLFVGLKLAKIIDWSWWFVVAPFYAPLTIVGISWLVTAIGWFLVSLAASWWTRRQAKKQKERLKGHALKA